MDTEYGFLEKIKKDIIQKW